VASVLSAAAAVVLVAWLAVRRWPVFVAFFFILFSFVWRLAAALNIDLSGPIHSEQLFREIGPGGATVVLAGAHLAVLLPFLFVFRRAQLRALRRMEPDWRTAERAAVTLPGVAVVLAAGYIGLLYVELYRSGVIPLSAGLERFEYRLEYGGIFNDWLFRYGNLFAFGLGLFYFLPRLRRSPPDGRFLGLLMLLLVYCFLTGHRFSAFYSYPTFFLIPYGAVALGHAHPSGSAPAPARGRRRRRWGLAKHGWTGPVAVVVVLFLVAYGFYNSHRVVRGYDPQQALYKFTHRLLVQHSEMWWVTYERVFLTGDYDPRETLRFIFVEPIDPSRNTSIQYLMEKAIGEQRTTIYAEGQFIYAGGFPEIYFELLGPVAAWPVILFIGWVTAELLFLVLAAIRRRRVLTVCCGIYVLYALLVMYIGGMLNFLVAWTFWVKVGALVIAANLEGRLASVGLSLVPWVWWRPDSLSRLATRLRE
jgi:hypothetical protein